MFILSKIISRLLFPVAIIIELCIAGMVLIRLRYRRSGLCLCIASLAVLYVSSINPVANSLLWKLEGQYRPIVKVSPKLKAKIGYIVVLGSGHSERSELSDTARLSQSATGRVTEAVRLSRDFPGIPIIFTGGKIGGKIPIGEAASRAAKAYGLASTRIIVETCAVNTAEEARAVSGIVGNRAVLLVTSASHMRRAVALFKATGIEVVPAPADYQSLCGSFTPLSLLPSAEALQKTERAWYEYMGIAWNAVRGVGI